MKIRHGFVSNSSSSSFLIYGYCIEDGDGGIKGLADKHNVSESKVEEIIEKAGLSLIYGEEGYNTYIGKSWSSIGDNETGSQFRKNIEDKIEQLFGEKKDCGTHEEAWRDG